MQGSLILWQLALVGSHASLPSKVYWQSVLPNTPMPKAVQDSLSSDGQILIQLSKLLSLFIYVYRVRLKYIT